MDIHSALACVAVNDLDEARSFYERIFGRPADQEPMPTLAQWDIEASGAVQVVVDTDRSRRSMVTLLVAELDATVSALQDAGIPDRRDHRGRHLQSHPGS